MREKISGIIKRLFFLPPFLTIVIAIVSFSFMIAALIGQISIPAMEYSIYVLSAYALIISITGIIRMVSFVRYGFRKHPAVKRLLSIPVVDKFISEGRFRTEMSLYAGFCINVLYVIFKTSMGIYYRSAWFISLGVYYFALAVMRFMLIHYLLFRRQMADKIGELKRYRMCGCMLFFINAALVGITILAVKRNDGFRYPGYLIYIMAMYTFYSVIIAVINLVKYRKYGSPVLSAAKVVNMSTALVSIFSLETAMLEQFGGESTEHFRVTMTALTGTGVSFIVIGMAVFMLIHSGRLIKKNMSD